MNVISLGRQLDKYLSYVQIAQQLPKPLGVNPRGLRPNVLWQMDVTHILAFGKLSFVHVTVDTFSHVITASARSGEAAKKCNSALVSVLFPNRTPRTDKNR